MQQPPQIGHYQIVRELGRGGMGVVYEAVDPRASNRRVAIKLILGGDAESHEAILRFGREAELLAKIQHGNVIRVHELGRCAQGPYLVTEFVEGGELIGYLRQGPLDPHQAAEIARALADALVTLHRHGVVHRDIKPHNIMLRTDSSPLLLDFGLARDVGAQRLTQTGVVVGTPAYMPPEQAEGVSDDLDPRSDIYGLGAVLFHMISGNPPFTASSLVGMTKKILLDEPEWPTLPPEHEPLLAILQQSMAKAPDDRYADAAALRDDLGRFLDGEDVLAAPPTKGSPLGIVVLGVLLVSALVGLFLITRPDPVETPQPEVTPVASESVAVVTSASAPKPTRPPLKAQAQLSFRHRARPLAINLVRFLGPDRVIGAAQYGEDLEVWDAHTGALLQRIGFPEGFGTRNNTNNEARLYRLKVAQRLDGPRVVAINGFQPWIAVFDLDEQGSLKTPARLQFLPRSKQLYLPTALGVSPDGSVAYLATKMIPKGPDGRLDESKAVMGELLRQPLEPSAGEAISTSYSQNNRIMHLEVINEGADILVLPGEFERSGRMPDAFVSRSFAARTLEKHPDLALDTSLDEQIYGVQHSASGVTAIATRWHRLALLRPGSEPIWLVAPDARAHQAGQNAYEQRTGTKDAMPAAHSAPVRSAVFTQDGAVLLSASGGRVEKELAGIGGTLQAWDVASGKYLGTLFGEITHGIYDLCLSPDGSRLLVSTDRSPPSIYAVEDLLEELKARRGD